MAIICYAFVHLDVHTKSAIETRLFEMILNELPNRAVENERFRPTLIACMCHLAINNCYDTNLIDSVLATVELDLNSRMPNFHYGNLLFLNSFVKVNLGENKYKGALLKDNARRKLAMLFSNNSVNTLISDIGQIIQEMYGHHQIARALPHFMRDGMYYLIALLQDLSTKKKLISPHFSTADIFVVLDVKRKRAVSKLKLFPPNQSGDYFDKKTLTDNNKDLEVFAVVLAGKQHYLNKDPAMALSGMFKDKIKQLKLLGFHPIVVHIFFLNAKNTQLQIDNIL